MLLKALTVTFRYPKPGEFGFNHCSGKVWYASFSLEGKPISWFMDKAYPVCWALTTPLNKINNSIIRNIDLIDSNFVKDGSYDIDDLELEIMDIDDIIGGKFTGIADKAQASIKGSGLNMLVLTGKLSKEDFIKEIKDFLYITNRTEFSAAEEWLTKRRFENNSFANKKQLLETIIPGAKTRGSVQIDLALQSYYSQKMGTAAKARLSDMLPFTDEEIVAVFNERLAKTLNIIDERALIAAAAKPCSEVSDFTKIYLGKITPNSMGINFVIGSQTNNGIEGYLKMDTMDGTMFRLSCISGLGGKNGSNMKFNVDIGKEICEKVKKHIKDNDGVYGRVNSIDRNEIDSTLEIVAEGMNDGFGSAFSSIELLPLADGITFGSWYANLQQVVKVSIAKDSCYQIVPKDLPNIDFSHEKLQEFEAAINSLISFEDPKVGKIDYTKANSPKLEDRKENIARRLTHVYNIFSEYLKYDWFVSLGCPNIPRAFIITELNQNTPRYDRTSINNFHTFLNLKKSHTNVTKSSSMNFIFSDHDNLPLIMMIKQKAGSWEEARKAATKIASKTNETSSTKVLDSILEYVCENTKQYIPQVAPLKLEDAEKQPKYKFKTDLGYAIIQLDYLIPFNIYQILKAASLMTLVENDTFINLGQESLKLLADPYYNILSIIRDNSSISPMVIKSMYAEACKVS